MEIYYQRLVSLADLHKLEVTNLIVALCNLSEVRAQINITGKEHGRRTIVTKDVEILVDVCLSSLEQFVQKYDLLVSQHAISRTLLKRNQWFYDDGDEKIVDHSRASVAGDLSTLNQTIVDELQTKFIAFVEPKHAQLFDLRDPFGKEVHDCFPKASEDIEEAGKCLALGIYTAVVFHLMRAMELAVQRMAEKLDIPQIEKEWGKLLSDIGGKIEKMPKGELRDEWSATHSHLYHVKQAWRNKTMHPKKTYTEDEAAKIYAAVQSFMAHLAPLVNAH